MLIRNIKESDYHFIVTALDPWWGGSNMADMLPRLFFKHFNDTSYVIEEGDVIVAFLIGFVSQSQQGQAYVHFFGVNPLYREKGYGRQLFEVFFEKVRDLGCESVHLVTSPMNSTSIAFYTSLGFDIEKGDSVDEGIDYVVDFDGPSGDRVLFVKRI